MILTACSCWIGKLTSMHCIESFVEPVAGQMLPLLQGLCQTQSIACEHRGSEYCHGDFMHLFEPSDKKHTVQLYLSPNSWKMKNASSTLAPPRYRFTQAVASCVGVESSSVADIAYDKTASIDTEGVERH